MRSLTFAQFTGRLNVMSTEFQTEVKGIVETSLGDIEQDAYSRAPGGGDRIRTQNGSVGINQIAEKRLGANGGNIAAAIGYQVDPSGYKGSVFVESSAGDISAYVEFGTGQSAASYLASTPPEWQALARRYYLTGKGTILAQPFLLPAFYREKPKFQENLKKALKDLRI